MKKITIDKESFTRYINDLKGYVELEDGVRKLFLDYSRSSKDDASIMFPSALFTDVLTLLESATGDVDGTVSYFVWDLNFGKDWKPGMITDKDGRDIPMGTIDDLWEELMRE